MTFPKVVVLLLKRVTSLRLYKLPGPALIQADLDYQKADVNQKLQEYVSASEGPSAKLDNTFIMAIEIGSVRLFSCLFKSYKAFISNFRCDKWLLCTKRYCWLQCFLDLAFLLMTGHIGAKVA